MKTAKATRKTTRPKAKAHTKASKPESRVKAKAKTKGAKVKMKAKGPALRAKRRVAGTVTMPKRQTKPKPMADVTPITDAGEYATRVFVRLDSENKELLREISAGVGLSPYIRHFAVEAAKAGTKLVAGPVIGKETGVFVRFLTAAVKKMVGAAAKECAVSMSSYCAYFAVQAAKAGKKMPETEKAAAAS